MGINFISMTKTGIKKGWDKAKKKLSLDELEFNCPPEKIRTVQVIPVDFSSAARGQKFTIKEEKGALLILTEGIMVGVCPTPPASIIKELNSLGGYGIGKLDGIKELSGLWDIAVYLEPLIKEVKD